MPIQLKLLARTNENFELVRTFNFAGEELPLADMNFEMHFRSSPDDANYALALTTGNGGISLIDEDVNDTLLTVSMSASIAQVASMLGNYYFDLRYTRNGITRVILEGECMFRKGITRNTLIA